MNNRKHYLAGVGAFFIWGTFPLALRAINDVPAGTILYYRILFSCIILLGIILAFKRRQCKEAWQYMQSMSRKKRMRAVLATLTGGVLLTINWLTYIYIVNSINIKTASFSYLLCPVITAVLGYLILKENLTTRQWLAVMLCAISCILIGLVSLRELAFSSITAVSYALYLITQRRNQWLDRLVVLMVQCFFSFTIMSVFYNYIVEEANLYGGFWGIVLWIAAFFTVLPLFLNLYALQRVTAATIGIFMYLNPLINFILAFILFHETVSPVQLIGYGVIFVALVLFNYSNIKRMQASFTANRLS